MSTSLAWISLFLSQAKLRYNLKLRGIFRSLPCFCFVFFFHWWTFISVAWLTLSLPLLMLWKSNSIPVSWYWDPVPLPSLLLMARTVMGKAVLPSFKAEARHMLSALRQVTEQSILFLSGRTGDGELPWDENGEQPAKWTFIRFVNWDRHLFLDFQASVLLC